MSFRWLPFANYGNEVKGFLASESDKSATSVCMCVYRTSTNYIYSFHMLLLNAIHSCVNKY